MKNLLNTRFEVIADFPKSIYKIGEIIDTGYDKMFCDENSEKFSDFPHLFRKLNWWEKRKASEMPEYLKHNANLENPNWTYVKIVKWDMNNLIGFVDIEKRQVCDLTAWSPKYSYLPATKEEYENSLL